MRKYAPLSVLLAAMFSTISAHSGERLPYEKAPYNDTLVQCGALFAIVAKAYENMGESDKSRKYKEEFDEFFRRSEEEFSRVGRSEDEVRTLYQERVNALAVLPEKDTGLTKRLIRFCDQEFAR